TAVLIQRDTGGNLAEILDNLAHVVRERFKIRRQVRVHTAHGRFTGWVLLALPAALAVALSFINPDHMNLLFHEHSGQMLLLAAAAPHSSSEMGKLQQKLLWAGYRSHDAIAVFFGIRIACALLGFALLASPILIHPSLVLALGACGIGYLLPSMVLGRLAKRRQHRIRLGLPDALDLLVVSVEAGLGLDQAIQRVGEELAFAHKDLADEQRLINLELRAGKARSGALHNLPQRTGLDDIQSLVAMLVQTD